MNLFWQISVVMLVQIDLLPFHRLGFNFTTINLSVITGLSITHGAGSRFNDVHCAVTRKDVSQL